LAFLGLGKDTLGEVPVPGEGPVTLPAGKVAFRYVEDRKGRQVDATSGKTWTGPSTDLKVTLAPAGGGEPVPIEPRRGIHEGTGLKAIHKDLGNAEVPAAGEYVISASMTVDEGNHHSPRIAARA
jgi:hypothetical protein